MTGNSDVSHVGNGAILPTTLRAPTNLVRDKVFTTDEQVAFNWSAPEDDGGSTILSYSVE